MRKFTYKIGDDFDGKDAKSFLRHMGYSADIIKGLKKGGLKINGEAAYMIKELKTGDLLETTFPDECSDIEPNFNPEIKLIYSDQDIAVMYKPPYVPTHQSIGHYRDTLANHFALLFPDTFFRAVTRLDKNTSGLCLIALNKLSSAIICANRPKKLYYAAVKGNIPFSGTVDAPIERECDGFIKRAVMPSGKSAVTHYKTVKEKGEYRLLEIELETGRTHQIRVHMSYIGFPLLGDEMYGGDTELISRQALHCGVLELIHPITKEKMRFEQPVPEDMEKIFE